MLRRHVATFALLYLYVFALTGESQVTKTERVGFPPGGLLRLNNSVGELTIEGWDRPEVEITTIKSKAAYQYGERETADKDLDRIRVTTERRDNEVMVTTEFPRYSTLPPPLRGAAQFDLEYRIKAPQTARLIVNHDAGEVHIENLTGDIRATVSKGGITLRLPADAPYTIDAKCDIGSVFSDFAGQEHRRPWIFGHRFAGTGSSAAPQLHLRVGFGDIAILKRRTPPYALR